MARTATRYPHSHAEALERLGTRQSVRLNHNTVLHLAAGDTVAVQLHATDVVTYLSNGQVRLDSGGWLTVVTLDRIRECLPSGYDLSGSALWFGWSRRDNNGQPWVVTTPNGARYEFYDGMVV